MSDKPYLRDIQYKDSRNLAARINLHQLFGTSRVSFPEWALDFYGFVSGDKVLDVGCGTGDFWNAIRKRLPRDLHLTLTDFSPGMLEKCREVTAGLAARYEEADVGFLPYQDGSFDKAVAHFMLYHADSQEKALSELVRVVKPAGMIGIATGGDQHMRRLLEVGRSIDQTMPSDYKYGSRFMENAADHLLPKFFRGVAKHGHDDALKVTDPSPLLEYLRSTPTFPSENASFMTAYEAIVLGEIQEKGSFDIGRRSVLYVCTEPWRQGDVALGR